MKVKFFDIFFLIVFISGCTGLQEKIGRDFDHDDTKVSDLAKDVGHRPPDTSANAPSPIVHNDGIWLSKKAVKVGQLDLPQIFYAPATFDRTVNSLSELAERITLRSGIPTKVSGDALTASYAALRGEQGGGSASGAVGASGVKLPAASTAQTSQMSMPQNSFGAGNQTKQTIPVHIVYENGNFKGLLDMTSARFGVFWKYVNGTIQFFYTDSRTFQISAIPGDYTYSASVNSGAASSGGVTGGGGGGGGGGSNTGVNANNTQNTNVTSQLSVYSSIEKSVSTMLSSYGKVVSSAATGTITVVDTPDSLDRIATFIENENKSLSKQVTINVTVLTVTLSNTDGYGINWSLVYSGLANTYGIKNTIASDPSSTGFTAAVLSSSSSKLAGSSLLINALSQQGKVNQKTTTSVVTLNNQLVPVQVATQTSYLQSSQTTLTAQVGQTTSLVPGTVTTGFNMSILPHILNNGTVMLQFSTDISSLLGLPTVSSNGSSIQTPEIATTNFMQRVSMKSNETLIISGYEATNDNLTKQGVGAPNNYLFGGGFNGTSTKDVIVILITPTLFGASAN